ncbi:MAG: VTT domain-containing protein [Nitrospirales bacterium]
MILLLLIAAGIFYVRLLYQQGELSSGIIEVYRDDHPIAAVLLFIALYASSMMVALPTLPLNLAGGYFWGGVVGGVFSATAVTLGGWASFCLARALIGMPFAKRFDNKWADKVRQEFERSGWKFIAFARLNPIIPSGPLNYLLGLTSTSHFSFLWSTFIFLLPPSIAVAYIGEHLKTFVADDVGVNSVITTILFCSGAVTFLACLKFASRLLHKKDLSYEVDTISDDAQRSTGHESHHAKDRSVVD